MPERLTVCEPPLALSEIVSAAARVPEAEGVKSTAIVQLAPAATEVPQLLVCAKLLALAPVTARLVRFKVLAPVLVSVTVCTVLVIAIDSLPKDKLLGETLTVGDVLAPVPERLTVWEPPTALSVMVNKAARVPLADGVKVKVMVHLAPAARVEPQLLAWAKSPALAPEVAMLVMFNAAVPELVRVAV